jgi:hypothetical protein
MTKEDLDKEYLIGMYSKYSKSGIFDHLVYAIDYIESIESRTCSNCKHLIVNDITRCRKDVASNIHKHLLSWKEDFGCNKWESKE